MNEFAKKEKEDWAENERRYEDLKAIAIRWVKEVWQNGNVDAIDKLHSSSFVDYSPTDRGSGRDAYKDGVIKIYQAFPDFFTVTEDLVVDITTNQVAIRWTAKGIHKGTFMGILPTGKSVNFQGVDILQIENSNIVKRWGEWDGIEILRQLDKPF